MIRFTLVIGLTLAISAPLAAHAIEWESRLSEHAIQIAIHYADTRPFANESYEIFAPDDYIPFQTGRSDALGRITFLPNRDGEWRIRFASADGHGGTETILVTGDEITITTARSHSHRLRNILAGLGYLLGAVGLYLTFRKRTT